MSAAENIPPGLTPRRTKTPFEEFLLAEYQYLAQAHFNTINTISEFFKQYILIVSLPISVAVVFLKPAELKSSGSLDYLKGHPSLVLILFLLVIVVGLGVLGYVVNLRFDAILYARGVNGIRKYFYKSSELSIEDELRFRVLPTWMHFPRYFELPYFLFVVLTFAFVDTAYCYVGLYFYSWAFNWPSYHLLWSVSGVAACFLMHIILYWWLSRYREGSYLRGHIIGVDIDGVLNEHRKHFCEVVKRQTGRQVDPEEITHIPVHEIPGSTVSVEDEHAVFNWPQYWTDMPSVPGAPKVIARLHNLFGYRIWIFTHRPWPQATTFPQAHEKAYWQEWEKHSKWARLARWRTIQYIERRIAEWFRIDLGISGRILRKITDKWLKDNEITFDKLIIERGNTDTRDPLGHTRNRFVISQRKKIRLFVEDDLNKALKLADICELVFLPDQPYNKAPQLPNNVIRVTSWQEIEKFLRRIY